MNSSIEALIRENETTFNPALKDTYIILAAGHGKRIKSNTSKMLHKVWGKTTIERVVESCDSGDKANIIVVTGIKAEEVINNLSKKFKLIYAYQENQLGTGHAVQIAMEQITDKNYTGNVYILLGDMGLLDRQTIVEFKNEFENTNKDMLVLTGHFQGPAEENYYGRIVRIKEQAEEKVNTTGNVVGIIENKDIKALGENEYFIFRVHNKEYKYSKSELLNTNEYNSGVFAFKFKYLNELIYKIENKNVQNEIYLTDLVYLFNKANLIVGAVSPENEEVLNGFNTKSVLSEMNILARKKIYNLLKDIIYIEDENDFFVSDYVLNDILERDKNGEIMDIRLGKGSIVDGEVNIGNSVKIGRNVRINGTINIGKNTTINRNCIIEGMVDIGEANKLNASVIIMGDKIRGTKTGENCLFEGRTKITNCEIGSGVLIESSFIENKTIKNDTGNGIKIRFIQPESEGKDFII